MLSGFLVGPGILDPALLLRYPLILRLPPFSWLQGCAWKQRPTFLSLHTRAGDLPIATSRWPHHDFWPRKQPGETAKLPDKKGRCVGEEVCVGRQGQEKVAGGGRLGSIPRLTDKRYSGINCENHTYRLYTYRYF